MSPEQARGSSLDQRMSRYLVDRLEAEPSITVRVRSRITRAAGDGRLERLVIADETASEEVEGVGTVRAREIREGLRRLQEQNLVDRYLNL